MCNFISLNKSPSQSKDIFESFVDNLQLNLNSITVKNPYIIVLLGDFNAQTSTWYNQGKRRITYRFGLQQLVHDPTHIKSNIILLHLIYIYFPDESCNGCRGLLSLHHTKNEVFHKGFIQ